MAPKEDEVPVLIDDPPPYDAVDEEDLKLRQGLRVLGLFSCGAAAIVLTIGFGLGFVTCLLVYGGG